MEQISLANDLNGHEARLLPIALDFFKQTFPNSVYLQDKDIISTLNAYLDPKNTAVDLTYRAKATLCLRCFVSHSILKACKKIDSSFAAGNFFSYRDLLSFVLNDDGKSAIILDRDRKTQLILDRNGKTKIRTHQIFAVNILQTYKHDPQFSMSLQNWTYLKTKQNTEVKDFLSECGGLKFLSDWTIINRVRSKQLELLSRRDRHFIEVFHNVYRRDRRKQVQKIGRCLAPNRAQLIEMLVALREREVKLDTGEDLIKELVRIANQLRNYDIWSCREPLEIIEPNTGNLVIRTDFSYDSISEIDLEEQEILTFLHEQLKLTLVSAIEREIKHSIAKLEKSKNYAALAPKYINGFQLYYCQGKSLKEIATLLGMKSWDRARRVLNPGALLSRVRASCVQEMLEQILKKASEKGLTKIPPEPDYLKTLSEQIEKFTDREVFQAAAAEMKTGKNRLLNSLYAEQIRVYCQKQI